MKPLIPPSLFSSKKRSKQATPDPSGKSRFDPPEFPASPDAAASPGAPARLIAERFLGEIQLEWARSAPRIQDLWQPPGE